MRGRLLTCRSYPTTHFPAPTSITWATSRVEPCPYSSRCLGQQMCQPFPAQERGVWDGHVKSVFTQQPVLSEVGRTSPVPLPHHLNLLGGPLRSPSSFKLLFLMTPSLYSSGPLPHRDPGSGSSQRQMQNVTPLHGIPDKPAPQPEAHHEHCCLN